MVKALLITNPRSGRGQIDLSEALEVLQAHGWQIQVREKKHGGQATALAQAGARAGCDVVVACAGDGTVSEVVDGLVGTDVAAGVLPGGTANLWAREIGISPHLAVAARQLAGAARRRVDVGHVSVNDRHGQHFLLMAGLGFDGAVMASLSKRLKRRMGKLAVGVAALQALPTYEPVEIHAEIGAVRWQGVVNQVTVANTRRYGGFTYITGDARIDDGLLDICLFKATSVIGVARQLGSLVLRQQPSMASAEMYRAASLVIQAPRVLPLQIDGGVVRLRKVKAKHGAVTYVFKTIAGAITMLVPREYDGVLFQHDALLSTRAGPLAATGEPCGRDGARGLHKSHVPHGARLYDVIAVGVDSLTVARADTGSVMTVLIGAKTGVKGLADLVDSAGSSAVRRFQPGDVVQLKLKGKTNGKRSTMRARQVKFLSSCRHLE
jgi:YegS/Rv2252/BmrU family lipid kinase